MSIVKPSAAAAEQHVAGADPGLQWRVEVIDNESKRAVAYLRRAHKWDPGQVTDKLIRIDGVRGT